MVRLAFDIYPPPVTSLGSRLVRLTNQDYGKGTFYTHQLSGVGAGQIVMERDQPDLTAANFSVGNYVIVRDLDFSEVSDSLNVIGGFFLERGDFSVISDPGEGVLRFGGPSTIAYLARAVMGNESLSPSEGPHSIIDGYWRWGVDSYGGVLRRALFEANYQDPPGLPMISTLTVGVDNIFWDDDDDSNGDPWPYFNDEFRTQCGTNLLTLAAELFGYGIEWDIDARTFDMYAFNSEGFGTDRSSATFASGKVRFAEAINIAQELERQTEGQLPLTHILMRTTDHPEGVFIESSTYSPGDPVRKGAYQTGDISGDPGASTVLQGRAERLMSLRRLAEDGITFHTSKPGNTPLSGRYSPGPNYSPGATSVGGHYWVGDWVTIHSGSEDFDYVNAKKRIESITYELREAADDTDPGWDIVIGVGARIGVGTTNLNIPVGATPIPLELCLPTIPPGDPSPPTLALDKTWSYGSSLEDDDATDYFAGGSWHSHVGHTFSTSHAGVGTNYTNTDPRSPVTPGQTVRFAGEVASYTLGYRTKSFVVRWYADIDDVAAASSATIATAPPSSNGEGVHTSFDGSLVVPAGITAFEVRLDRQAFYDNLVLQVINDDAGASSGGRAGGGLEELVGTSSVAARCGHQHHVLREGSPTPTDDLEHGYPEGTVWLVVDDVDNPTTVIARYLLINDANGAAVWVQELPEPSQELGMEDLVDVDVLTNPPTDGQVLVWDAGESAWIPQDFPTPEPVLPLTAVVDGEPVLVWDEDNSLIGAG